MKKWILAVVLLVVMLGIGLWLFWRLRRQSKQVVGGLPLEMTVNFDPTVNTPVFAVEGVATGSKELQLKFLFPEIRKDEKVSSVIKCETIQVAGKDYITDLGLEQTMKLLGEPIVFVGLCQDLSCKEIWKDCRVIKVEVIK